MAGTVSFTGISSNTDFNSIIDALVEARRKAHITPLKNWGTQWTTKLSAISRIDTALSSFYTNVRGMDRLSELMSRTASSSSNAVTASASSEAAIGSHTVVVGTAIKNRFASDGKVDRNITVYASAGTSLDVTVGGTLETITFAGNSTLDQMASAINSQSSLVTAEVVDDGSTSNRYRLVLTSKTGGSGGNIAVSNNTTSANFNLTPAQSVDTAEPGSGWGGTATVSSGGQYLGSTNKTFRFTIAGTGEKTLGTDDFSVTWSDGEGNSGTLDVTASDFSSLSVYQGVTTTFGAPGQTVKGGDTFSIDVWNNTLQAGQEAGVAQAEQVVHAGFSDSDTTAVTTAAGSFSYAYNGRVTTVNVAGGSTLTDLQNLINNDASNPGVTASIVNDGSGLSTSYHLVLTGKTSGAAYQITSLSHTLDQFSGTFSESQSAQNAMIKLDSYPPGDIYLQRSGNHVTDALAGVTLNVQNAGSATVTIATDTGAMIDKIKAFKEAFNNVRTAVRAETYYDRSTKEGGSLIGNYGVQIVKQMLDNIVAAGAPGFQSPADTYSTLQQLGFSTDATEGSDTEGLLLLDEGTLTAALTSNPDAVADVFAAYLMGVSDSSTVAFTSALTTTSPGIYEVQVDTDPASLNYRMGRFRVKGETTWHGWVALSGTSGAYTLTGTSGGEKGLALQIAYADGHAPTADTPDATVRVKNGILTQLSQSMQKILSQDGPLNTITDNYSEILGNIDKRIATEETRLAKYKVLLQKRFARLDTYIGQMSALTNFLNSYSASSTSSSSSSNSSSG